MKLLNYSDKINSSDKLIATIGIFDGVHLGHNLILKELVELAHKNNYKSAVVTFSNHPQFFFNESSDLRLIMDSKQKLDSIAKFGVDYCIFLDFSAEIASLTSAQFMHWLNEQFNVVEMLIGYDHKFGHDRNSTFQDYKKNADYIGIKIIQAPEFIGDFGKVSSSRIRKAISSGDIALANEMLGHIFELTGKIISGQQKGRTIGFPTANLEIPHHHQILPKNGVYAVKIAMESEKIYNGICNIGVRPTVDDMGSISIETNIFDFDGDIYGKKIKLYIIDRIRDEIKFNSLYELKEQISRDKIKAEEILENKI